MGRNRTWRSAALACLALSACVAADERDVLDCSSPVETHADGALRIGQEVAGEYVSLEAGEHAELSLGPQGAWMIEPVLDLSAPEAVASELCVELSAEVDGGEEPEFFRFAVPFHSTADGTRRSEVLFLPLSFELEGVIERSAIVSASVSGHGVATAKSLRVTLANDR